MSTRKTWRVRAFAVAVVGLLLAGGAAILGAGSRQASAQGNELVVAVFGGTFEKAWRANVIQAFEKEHNARVRVVTGLSAENFAKLRAGKDNPQIDVVTFDAPFALVAAREGLLETLDPQRIPNLGQLHDFALPKDRAYVAFFTSSQVLAYNTQNVKTAPTSWADLWKPEYKGKVVLPEIGSISGAYFVAMMGKAFGKDLFDDNAAFERVKTLRPNVLTFWTSHDQLANLLVQGEAWLSPWASDRAAFQIKSGAPIGSVVPKEGAIFGMGAMGIAKGSKQRALAEQYVNYSLAAAPQKLNAETMFIGPTNRGVQLGDDVAKLVPYGENLKRLVAPDWDEFGKRRDQWVERWNREIK
jgi:putative spermidine/putrescine transport system substrate-binding protein